MRTVVEGTKTWSKKAKSDDIGDLHKDISKDIASDTVIETDNVMTEMSLTQKVEKGKWHKIVLHRNAGGIDDMGFVQIPNYVQQTVDYFLQYDIPQWVPDYVVNILKESKRRETRYDRRVENGEQKMVGIVSETVCHPFSIEETVVGVPDVVLKARRKGL